MELIFWWVSVILLVAAALAVFLLSRPRRRTGGNVPVAHLDRVTALPAFARRRTVLLLGAVAAFLVVVLTALVALVGIARPVRIEAVSPERERRDVMLCLDVSGSMLPYDAEIIDSYLEMIESFDGERIGMTVFNQSAILSFPLTDDYDMATEYLTEAQEAVSSWEFESSSIAQGTFDWNIPGASLIGDGLASCIDNFDRDEEDRSRSVVFATDNVVSGVETFTVPEATELAVDIGARIYPLYPDSFWAGSEIEELVAAAEDTGGVDFPMSSASAAEDIVYEIQAQEAALTDAEPIVLVHDRPVVWLVLTLFGLVAVLVLSWRFRL
ncbi:vWA domain-containing protein [Brevibacterium litoralis]|uniref:vWA domain-containing protein n=1 Tax=Brevibacterium litoralis TaxID=3138935 RepID=UPI0032EBE749